MSIRSTTPPDEERLQALIAEAYEALPAPDPWRLKDLEEHLTRRLAPARTPRARSAWAWWFAGALLAASVAAAWWTYQTWREPAALRQSVPITRDQAPAQNGVTGERDAEQRTDGKAGDSPRESGQRQPPAQQQGPVIYQRETH